MNDDRAFGMLCMLAVMAGVVALMITIWWRIFDKTGYGGAMSLLMLLPIINLIMLLVLAFGEWPIQQEVRRLRRALDDRDEYGGGRRFGGDLPSVDPRRRPEGESDPGYRQ